jgi:hypothetical protein
MGPIRGMSKNTYGIGFHTHYNPGYSPDYFRRQGNRINHHEDSRKKHAPCYAKKPRAGVYQSCPSAFSMKKVM